jgi:hypothetical protein
MGLDMAHELVDLTPQQPSLPVGRDRTDLISEVTSVELPDVVLDVVEEYERVLSDRDTFLWQWIHSLFDAFTLSSVDDRDVEEVKETKTLFTVFITTLDDLVESHDDTETFEEARRVVRDPDTVDPSREGVDADVLAFVEDLWARIDESLQAAPRYGEFKDIFDYDLRQGFNAMEYTRLVSDNAHIANATGARTYDAHNMVLFPYTDIDLMFSSRFDLDDLSALRDLTWDLQKMARIGNWVTTWERELTEGDYSAGVIVQAIQDDVVRADELDPAGDLEAIAERIKECGVEEAFLDEWCQRHRRVCEREYDIESVDVGAYIGGMETVMEYHLASRGMK